jgi:hypothetical protein
MNVIKQAPVVYLACSSSNFGDCKSQKLPEEGKRQRRVQHSRKVNTNEEVREAEVEETIQCSRLVHETPGYG